MILCITEKPSVANDIARILKADRRQNGFFEGNGYCVTWTYGHLCCLKEPHDYSEGWKKWSISTLPMLPARFGIKLIENDTYRRQFEIIEDLAAKASEIINCGDAGQEGELIQRWVMQKAGIKCPVKRLWISSLTDQSIRDGFAMLEPQEKYDNLYYAGLSRAIGDWILGMNATRLYSLKYSEAGKVLSIGRVQTPTLAMIVRRHQEIENFVAKDFWELHTLFKETDFTASGKFESAEKLQLIIDKIANYPFTVDEVAEKQGREAPPRLFDLTSLQVECNRLWGWTADESLRLIQSLYEKKVTTYPRVDTTYLPDDLYPKIPEILKLMTPYAPKTAPILSSKIHKSKKIFDNSKVTDHHAIIPTGESPSRLIGDERKLYHLIALRFIAAFYPDCSFKQTVVTGHIDDIKFKATGKVITNPGWRTILDNRQNGNSSEKEAERNEEDNILPDFIKGESGPHHPRSVKKTTQPPKPYTEGTLLRAMETAGKSIDDESLREALKENGIGRPSTRASIIETLFKRHYIERRRKSIFPTQAGIDLIATIKEDLLKSASLTGIWENKLRRISRGEYSAAEFISELKTMMTQIVTDVMRDSSHLRISVEEIKDPDDSSKKKERKKKNASSGKSDTERNNSSKAKNEPVVCPRCRKGTIIKGRTAYGCSEYASGCSFRMPFEKYSPDMTLSQLRKTIKSEGL